MPRPVPQSCRPVTRPVPRSGATTCVQANLLRPRADTVFEILLEDDCKIVLEDGSGKLLLEG